MEHDTLNEASIIIGTTKAWFAESAMDIHAFTEQLLPRLANAGLLDGERYQGANDADSYLKARKSSVMMIGRIMRGTSELPLAWKWCWIDTLPPAYQTNIKRDLQALAGQLSVELPAKKETTNLSRISSLTQEFSEVLASAAPTMDGQFDANDSPEACNKYIDEIFDLVEVALEEVAAVKRGTGCEGRRHKYHQLMKALKGAQ